ncbi:hypothetical protein KRP22_000900 [Phytophthora ramorum]|nr:Sacsin [Phytophthora ramorum]
MVEADVYFGDDFGQKIDLTVRIREILRNYPEGTSIFKEMVQNADDAGATEVNLCLDYRQHASTGLAYEKLESFQGPALLVHNNATFTDVDFQSIQRIGDSLKKDNSKGWKTGRFGVGFNSVYHVTDLPAFVSGSQLVFFDPQACHLPNVNPSNPGKMIDFIAHPHLVNNFPDQIIPFRCFGCNFSEPFSGTIFRLALRTEEQAKRSKLSNRAQTPVKLAEMLQEFAESLPTVLLFLRNVCKISVWEWKAGEQEPTVLQEALISNMTAEIEAKRSLQVTSLGSSNQLSSQAFSIDGIVYDYPLKIEARNFSASLLAKEYEYLIMNQLGGGECTKIACDPVHASQRLVPWGGVAVSTTADATSGLAFCFLPLPTHTYLPVHVNGYFELSSNRRDIWFGEGLSGDGLLRAQWNIALLRDVIAPCYARAILHLASNQAMKPDRHVRLLPQALPPAPWDSLTYSFFSLIRSKPCLYSEVGAGRWVSPMESLVIHSNYSSSKQLEQLLIDDGFPVVRNLAEDLERVLVKTNTIPSYVEPQTIREAYKLKHSCHAGAGDLAVPTRANKLFEAAERSDREHLLRFLMSDEDIRANHEQICYNLPIFPGFKSVDRLETITVRWVEGEEGLRNVGNGFSPAFVSLAEIESKHHQPLLCMGIAPKFLDDKFIFVKEGDLALAEFLSRLGAQRISKVDFFAEHLIPRFNSIEPASRVKFIYHLLVELTTLLAEDADGILSNIIETAAIFPSMAGDLKCIDDLYDPDIDEFMEIMDESFFPALELQDPQPLSALRSIGLQRALSRRSILSLAVSLENDQMTITSGQENEFQLGEACEKLRSRSIKFFQYVDTHIDQLVTPTSLQRQTPTHVKKNKKSKGIRFLRNFLGDDRLRGLDGLHDDDTPTAEQLEEHAMERAEIEDFKAKLAIIVWIPTERGERRDQVLAILSGNGKYVWVGDHFVSATHVATVAVVNAEPYLYTIPNELLHFRPFLRAIGVRERFALADYIHVLGAMHKECLAVTSAEEEGNVKASPISGDQLTIVIGLIQLISDTLQHHSDYELFAPDRNGVLEFASNLTYDDAPWLDKRDYETTSGSARFIHPKISNEVAAKIGSRSLRSQLLSESGHEAMSFGAEGDVEAFGQTEALTKRIAHILEQYPDGPNIISELIQNADDAGATRVCILYSSCTYGTSSLLSPAMVKWQGPSLYCYNDAEFSDGDFINLARIGQASKLQRAATTGRFGLGFNSVYHFTDLPSIVSANSIGA